MWPGFKSWARCNVWVEFLIGSRPCYEVFTLGFPVSSLNKKKKPLQIQNFHSIWKQCTTITSTDGGAGGGGTGGRAVVPPLFPKNRDLIRVSSVPHFKSLISSLISPLPRPQLGKMFRRPDHECATTNSYASFLFLFSYFCCFIFHRVVKSHKSPFLASIQLF